MKKHFICALLAATLSGCSGGKTSEPDISDRDGWDPKVVIPYSVSGNRIILPSRVDTRYFCDGSEMEIDTIMIESNSMPFSVSGNELILIMSIDTTPSGAVIHRVSQFTRNGPGTGLMGAWKDEEVDYRVISGEPTQEEKDEVDTALAMRERYGRFDLSTLTFAENTLTLSVDMLTAEQFLSDWNEDFFPGDSPDSAKYDITVKIVDRYTVELKGNLTGETVRINILPKGDRTYTSSDAEHPPGRHVSVPKTCPNDFEPMWYFSFLEENSFTDRMEPAEKSGKNREKGRQSPLFPFFPLKPAFIFLN